VRGYSQIVLPIVVGDRRWRSSLAITVLDDLGPEVVARKVV
jgi:hypothetical protein